MTQEHNRVVSWSILSASVFNYGHGTISVGFKATLNCGRVPASESSALLMIGNNHEKDLISLLETLKDTTELQ